MKLKVLLSSVIAFLALSQVACAEEATTAPAGLTEGKDFAVIEGAKGVKKPEVIEFFSYSCPHCYTMEGIVAKWLPNKPAEVKFEQVPVYMSQAPHLARAYYTAQVLKVLDKVHPAMFHKWHKERKIIRRKQDLLPIFAAAGVPADKFESAYNSFAVESKVQYAKKLARDFKITSFPKFIVNQKYGVESYENLDKMLSVFPVEMAK